MWAEAQASDVQLPPSVAACSSTGTLGEVSVHKWQHERGNVDGEIRCANGGKALQPAEHESRIKIKNHRAKRNATSVLAAIVLYVCMLQLHPVAKYLLSAEKHT